MAWYVNEPVFEATENSDMDEQIVSVFSVSHPPLLSHCFTTFHRIFISPLILILKVSTKKKTPGTTHRLHTHFSVTYKNQHSRPLYAVKMSSYCHSSLLPPSFFYPPFVCGLQWWTLVSSDVVGPPTDCDKICIREPKGKFPHRFCCVLKETQNDHRWCDLHGVILCLFVVGLHLFVCVCSCLSLFSLSLCRRGGCGSGGRAGCPLTRMSAVWGKKTPKSVPVMTQMSCCPLLVVLWSLLSFCVSICCVCVSLWTFCRICFWLFCVF